MGRGLFWLALCSILLHSVLAQVDTVCHVDGTCIDGDLIDTVNGVEDANACLDECANIPSRDCVSWTFGVDNKNCFLFRNKCTVQLGGPCSQPGECVSGNSQNCDKDYDCTITERCAGRTITLLEDKVSQDECLLACKEAEERKNEPGADRRGCPYYTWEVNGNTSEYFISYLEIVQQ